MAPPSWLAQMPTSGEIGEAERVGAKKVNGVYLRNGSEGESA
jgi:hypothetical protein